MTFARSLRGHPMFPGYWAPMHRESRQVVFFADQLAESELFCCHHGSHGNANGVCVVGVPVDRGLTSDRSNNTSAESSVTGLVGRRAPM